MWTISQWMIREVLFLCFPENRNVCRVSQHQINYNRLSHEFVNFVQDRTRPLRWRDWRGCLCSHVHTIDDTIHDPISSTSNNFSSVFAFILVTNFRLCLRRACDFYNCFIFLRPFLLLLLLSFRRQRQQRPPSSRMTIMAVVHTVSMGETKINISVHWCLGFFIKICRRRASMSRMCHFLKQLMLQTAASIFRVAEKEAKKNNIRHDHPKIHEAQQWHTHSQCVPCVSVQSPRSAKVHLVIKHNRER